MSVEKARKEETVVAELEGREITVIPRYCKGCEICVKFCPKSVLEIKDFQCFGKLCFAKVSDEVPTSGQAYFIF